MALLVIRKLAGLLCRMKLNFGRKNFQEESISLEFQASAQNPMEADITHWNSKFNCQMVQKQKGDAQLIPYMDTPIHSPSVS